MSKNGVLPFSENNTDFMNQPLLTILCWPILQRVLEEATEQRGMVMQNKRFHQPAPLAHGCTPLSSSYSQKFQQPVRSKNCLKNKIEISVHGIGGEKFMQEKTAEVTS